MPAADPGVVESVWPVPVIAGVAVLVLLLLAVVARSLTATRLEREAVQCPVSGKAVSVDWEVDAGTGRRVGIVACTAFTPPTAVACDRACLRSHVASPAAA